MNEQKSQLKTRIQVGKVDIEYSNQNLEEINKYLEIMKETVYWIAEFWNPETYP